MSYRITAGEMSQAEAERIGKFFGQYEIQVSGLTVYQVTVDGQRHRDDALLNTIKDTIGEVGGAIGSAATGAAAAPVLIPIIGLIPPLGAIMAAIASLMSVLSATAPITLPALKVAEYKLNKNMARAGYSTKPIDHTEVEFGISGESAKHQPWTEYLLGAMAMWSGWYDVKGYKHVKMFSDGQGYALRYNRLPPPRNPKLRDGTFAGPAPAANLPTSPMMMAQYEQTRSGRTALTPQKVQRQAARRKQERRTSRQTISRARRAWWRIMDEL